MKHARFKTDLIAVLFAACGFPQSALVDWTSHEPDLNPVLGSRLRGNDGGGLKAESGERKAERRGGLMGQGAIGDNCFALGSGLKTEN